MITQDEFETYLNELPSVGLSFPFGETMWVYGFESADADKPKLFAVIEDGSVPLKISLRCDPQLAATLVERFETVLPAKNFNKRHWITVLATGQLSDDDLKDLARHSYELAKK